MIGSANREGIDFPSILGTLAVASFTTVPVVLEIDRPCVFVCMFS